MTDKVTLAATVLKEHRQSIDRLDAILIYTLGERFKHTQAVGTLKAEHDLPPQTQRARPHRLQGLRIWQCKPISTRNLPKNF